MATNHNRVSRQDDWRSLRLFTLYRLLVVALLFTLYFMDSGPKGLGRIDPELFLILSSLYLAAGLWLATTALAGRPGYHLQVYQHTAVDISLITLLTYASGGVANGLGLLAIPAVAGLGLLAPGRLALLFASLATIALLSAELYGMVLGRLQDAAFTQTGLLGAGLFATALTALALSRRAKESEALARRHSVDLANMTELNAHIIDRMQSGVIVVSDQGYVHLINEAAWNLLGNPGTRDPASLREISPPLYAALQEWLLDPQPQTVRSLGGNSHNPELRVRFTRLGVDAAVGTLIFLEDTAEMRRQMQALKLASVGRLTASIAHEIRNPLGAISHAAQLLAESEALEPPDRRLLKIIQDQGQRMNTIIQNILGLSRRNEPSRSAIPLKEWLERFAEEFRRHQNLQPEQLQVQVHPEDSQAWFDPEQLHQVLWNLCVNALSYGTRPGEPPRIELHGASRQISRHATLDVIDHGHGVDPIVQRRLFEPFVTTGADGTGLGLYLARDLCENNGASLEYIPMPSGGSCFRIQFAMPEMGV